MARSQVNYRKLVGRVGNEYYFLDYTFENGDHKGAVGSIMVLVTKDDPTTCFDRSYPEYEGALMDFLKEVHAVFAECVGGGRCFKRGQKFDEVFDQELVDKVNEVEGES